MSAHQQQMQAIKGMLVSGHRSVHLERHSLMLIGVVGGFIAGATEYIITDSRFPEVGQRALALLVWLAVWLSSMAAADHWLTRRARLRRDETLPFAQAQITRAWWMLLVMGTLGSFAMFFYGGGAMIYALWIVLLGLGIYLFGLFSRPLVEWIGLSTILLGVAGLAAGLPYGATHWLAASCFAIGMPLAGWLNSRYGDAGPMLRGLCLLFWLSAVVTPPLMFARLSPVSGPDAFPLAATNPALLHGTQVLRMPVGASIPLRIDLDSPILDVSPRAELHLALLQPVEVALHEGRPDGRYRIADGQWHSIRDGVLRLKIDRITPQLDGLSPELRAHAILDGAEFRGDAP